MTKYLVALSASSFIAVSTAFSQGSLTPPGTPAPTMKSLEQIRSTGIAVNATNTPGTAASQFVIYSPGSYFVTGDIVGVSGKNAILIESANVSLDLNGFELVGVSGSLAGITDGGLNQGNIVIQHGTVRSWGGAGIDLSHSFDSVISNLIVTDCGGIGMTAGDAAALHDCVLRNNHGTNIVTGFNANVSHCTTAGSGVGYGLDLGQDSAVNDSVATFNKLGGIKTAPNCQVAHVTASQNAGDGIICGTSCSLSDSTASGNTSDPGEAIFADTGSTVTNCTASHNTVQYGIFVSPNSTMSHCTASYNVSAQSFSAGIFTLSSIAESCTVASNTSSPDIGTTTSGMGIANGTGSTIRHCLIAQNQGDGINVGDRNTVRDNVLDGNGASQPNSHNGAGIHAAGSGNRIDGNEVTNSGAGIRVDATVNLVIRNTARGSTANYSIVAGNRVGTITVPATSSASGNTGGAAVSTDAWVNIAY